MIAKRLHAQTQQTTILIFTLVKISFIPRLITFRGKSVSTPDYYVTNRGTTPCILNLADRCN